VANILHLILITPWHTGTRGRVPEFNQTMMMVSNSWRWSNMSIANAGFLKRNKGENNQFWVQGYPIGSTAAHETRSFTLRSMSFQISIVHSSTHPTSPDTNIIIIMICIVRLDSSPGVIIEYRVLSTHRYLGKATVGGHRAKWSLRMPKWDIQTLSIHCQVLCNRFELLSNTTTDANGTLRSYHCYDCDRSYTF